MRFLTADLKPAKKKFIAAVCAVLTLSLAAGMFFRGSESGLYEVSAEAQQNRFIKWVDFSVSCTAMKQALKYQKSDGLDWLQLLSVAACKNGGHFSDKKNSDIDDAAKRLKNGESIDSICSSKYYSYYLEAYTAVLTGLADKDGLTAYSPIAKGRSYSHSDDFGNGRSYGFKRRHLGNDLMGSVGTPIIAVEGGIIETMGWNRYGGWRIGIRSFDTKRYYYYAHLRRGHPYVNTLKEGMEVKAGDVIGYLGMTGYSDNEDYNGMQVPHLHFGMQIIFDESQKDSNNEIWIDVYEIINLLQNHRSAVRKNEQSGDYERADDA